MASASRASADVASFEEKVASAVSAVVEVAGEIGASATGKLANIEHNTREIFWWTSWAIGSILGLFILHLLVRLSAQLMVLNGYQAEFQRMWIEDRENDDRIRREEKRERHIKEVKEAENRREASGRIVGAAQSRTRMQNYWNELIDEIDPVPAVGTSEYDEYLNNLGEVMQ